MIGTRRLGDRLRGVVGLGVGRLIGDPVTESFIAVRFARGMRCAPEGRRRASGDWRVDPHASGDLACVARGARHIGIPMTGRDAHELELREARGECKRHGIIDAGIGIDQNG
jgi:hypothetical protein